MQWHPGGDVAMSYWVPLEEEEAAVLQLVCCPPPFLFLEVLTDPPEEEAEGVSQIAKPPTHEEVEEAVAVLLPLLPLPILGGTHAAPAGSDNGNSSNEKCIFWVLRPHS